MRASMLNGLNSLIFLVFLLLCSALHAGAGEWELLYDNGGVPFEAAPAMGGDTVFLADFKGDVVALQEGEPVDNPFDDQESIGRPTGFGVLWKTSLEEAVKAAPVVGRDGVLYVLTEACTLFALDRYTGAINWEMSVDLDGGCITSPAVSMENRVYVVTNQGRVRALYKGSVVWSLSLGEKVFYPPALGPDGTLFVGDSGGVLSAVKDGSVVCDFQADSAITGQPALTGGEKVIFGTVKGGLYAVSAADCALEWSFDLGAGADGSLVVDAGGTIHYINGDRLGFIDGNGLDHRTVAVNGEESINGSPLITENGVWMQDRDGNLYMSSGGDAALVTQGFGGVEKFYAFPGVDRSGNLYAAAYSGKLYRSAAAPLDLRSPWPSWGQYSENRSGDWPNIFTTTSSLKINCPNEMAKVSDTLSLTNGGPGILKWRAELNGVEGEVVPREGEISPWNWVYPKVRIEAECIAEGDKTGSVTIFDQFGASSTIPLTVLKNPVCISESRLDLFSCERTIPAGFFIESCTGRDFTYTISAPSWVHVENPEGAVQGGGIEEILLTVEADKNLDPSPEGEILISGIEGELRWSRTLPVRVVCGNPVTKLNVFDGTAIAGIGLGDAMISILSQDRCSLLDLDSGQSLLDVERSGMSLNYFELDWEKDLVDDGREFRQGAFSYSTPLLSDDRLYVPCSDDYLRAYSIPSQSDLLEGKSAELEWAYDAEGLAYGPPVKGGEDDKYIYTVSSNGLLSCIKDKNGDKEWDRELDDLESFNEFSIPNEQGGTYYGVVPAEETGVVIVTSRARNIMAFDAEDGELLNSYTAGALLGTPPVPYGDASGRHLVFGTWGGHVGILSPEFQLEDRCDVGDPVSGTLFIHNSTIFAGNTAGVVTAVDMVEESGDSGSTLKCRKRWQTDLATGADGENEEVLWAIHPFKSSGVDLWVMVTPMGGESPARIVRINIVDGSVVKLIHEFEEGERIIGVPETRGERTFFLTLDRSGEQGTLYQVLPQETSPVVLEYRVDPEDLVMCPEDRLSIDVRIYQEQGDIRLLVEGDPLKTIPAGEIPLGEYHEILSLPNLEYEGILGDWELRIESTVNSEAFTLTVQESCE